MQIERTDGKTVEITTEPEDGKPPLCVVSRGQSILTRRRLNSAEYSAARQAHDKGERQVELRTAKRYLGVDQELKEIAERRRQL